MINILNFIKRTLLKWILNNESYHKYEELNELDSIVDEMIENPIIFKKHKVKLYGLKCIRKFNKLVSSINNVDENKLKRKNIEDYMMNDMICGDDILNIYSEQMRIELELYKIIENNVELIFNVIGNGKILRILIDHLPEKYIINNGIRIEYGKVFQFKNREFDIISKEEAKFLENVDKITIFLLNSCINIDLFDKCIKHYRENVGNYSEFVEKKIKYLYEWNELITEFISKSSEIMKNMSNNMYKGKDDIYNG